jgi:hypothetical protein
MVSGEITILESLREFIGRMISSFSLGTGHDSILESAKGGNSIYLETVYEFNISNRLTTFIEIFLSTN